jgi:hypothetical protein
MSSRRWHRTTFGMAAAAATMLGTAWAKTPDAGRVCGTPGASVNVAGGSAEDRQPLRVSGRSGRAGTPNLFSPLVQIPAVGTTALPVSAGPAPVATSTPPTPSGPPAIPGLPPPPVTAKEKEKEKEKEKGRKDRAHVEAIQATADVPEERLLDVGVAVFDPEVGDAELRNLAKKGVTPELRRAESHYVSFHLKKTLEGTGHWGAVRVLPGPGEGVDVFVSGRIVRSTGKDLEVEVDAVDATGRRWLHKRYKDEADEMAYEADHVGQYEPFQNLYNRVANDLLEAREHLKAAELVAVRRVSHLRFAAALAPEAFSPYLQTGKAGRWSLRRLPAEGDPMARRVSDIRDRDQMFVDTLNDYYLSYYERMVSPYASWRQHSYEEQAALDKVTRESRLKKILGGAAILAGVVMMGSDSEARRVGGDIAMLGGYAVLQAGSRQAQEKAMHESALKELATQAEGDVTPLLVEVEGQQLKLTGSAEKQFTQWRELLARVFAIETGVPDEPNAPMVSAPPSR